MEVLLSTDRAYLRCIVKLLCILVKVVGQGADRETVLAIEKALDW